MDVHRRTRAAALCAALSGALVVGMAGTAVAFSPPDPPEPPHGRPAVARAEMPADGPMTTPALTARVPAP